MSRIVVTVVTKTNTKRVEREIGQVKRKSAFKYAQNAQIQIILRMRKVSSGPLLDIRTFCNTQWFFSHSEGSE